MKLNALDKILTSKNIISILFTVIISFSICSIQSSNLQYLENQDHSYYDNTAGSFLKLFNDIIQRENKEHYNDYNKFLVYKNENTMSNDSNNMEEVSNRMNNNIIDSNTYPKIFVKISSNGLNDDVLINKDNNSNIIPKSSNNNSPYYSSVFSNNNDLSSNSINYKSSLNLDNPFHIHNNHQLNYNNELNQPNVSYEDLSKEFKISSIFDLNINNKYSLIEKEILKEIESSKNNTTMSDYLVDKLSTYYQAPGQNSKLTISYGSETEKYKIVLKRFSHRSFNSLILTRTGSLCLLTTHANFYEDCFVKFMSIHSNWIVVIENIDQFLANYKRLITGMYGIQAIIIKENTVSDSFLAVDDKNPIFIINNEGFTNLVKYDINEEVKTGTLILATIEYKGIEATYQGQNNLLIIMYCLITLYVVFVVIWFWFVFYKMKNYYTQLQRYYTPLPFMLFLITLGILYSVYSQVKRNDSKQMTSILFDLLTEILIKLIKIIYKTFLWILLILISYGFLITNYVNKSTFFFIFSIVYIGFLSDLIINEIISFDNLFGIIDFSLLKTTIFFLVYLFLITKQTLKILSKANTNYLREINSQDELTQTVLLKISLLKWNLLIVISYLTFYISGNYSLAFYYGNSDTLYATIYNVVLDVIVLVLVLINLKPRKLMHQYEGINFLFEEFNSILRVKIKKSKLRAYYNKLYFNQNNKKIKKNEESIISKALNKKEKVYIRNNPDDFVVMVINPIKDASSIDISNCSEYYSNNKYNNLTNSNAFSNKLSCQREFEKFGDQDNKITNNDINIAKATAINDSQSKNSLDINDNLFNFTVLSNFCIGTIEEIEKLN